jgi:hypothetical protein
MKQDVDARHKAGHDEEGHMRRYPFFAFFATTCSYAACNRSPKTRSSP